MTQPFAALDHVVVNVRDRMEQACIAYQRLGFSLTPRGFHSLGSINHLAIFDSDYLELIGNPTTGPLGRLDFRTQPAGLNGYVFACTDADDTYRDLLDKQVPSSPPMAFTRPVDVGGESRAASFRVVQIDKEAFGVGRVYFCEHATRELVWRDEWRSHPNGASGISRVVWVVDQVAPCARRAAEVFGMQVVSETAGGILLALRNSEILLTDQGGYEAAYGEAVADGSGQPRFMGAMHVRVNSLAKTRQWLLDHDVRLHTPDGRVVVMPDQAINTTIEFVQ